MNIYLGNKERSIELHNRNREHIEQKMCYNNTFNIMSCDDDVLDKVITGEWKIAYCFFKVFDSENIYVRHCCFLDAVSDEMIDALKTYHREPALEEFLYDKTETLRAEMISEGLLAID